MATGDYQAGVIFERLRLWIDPVARPGPEAMAVDEWLLEHATEPVLRVYGWSGDWASVGYFGDPEEAAAAFPGTRIVRRWTGGGMVDHRADWTYTLVVPAADLPESWCGGESYRAIHAALVGVLAGEGLPVLLSGGEHRTGLAGCFENPVEFDLLGPAGRKVAGAGQRRNRSGLLHQGSVAGQCMGERSSMRARLFATALAPGWTEAGLFPDQDTLAERIRDRYGNEIWSAGRKRRSGG